MENQWTCSSIDELPGIANEILEKLPNRKLAVSGQLGSGKTTFVKEICRQLGIKDNVTSPTFTILNEYAGNGFEVYHFDFFRVEKTEEIYDIGYEDYLYSDEYVFIEWPDKLKNLLPPSYPILQIEILENGDRIYRLRT